MRLPHAMHAYNRLVGPPCRFTIASTRRHWLHFSPCPLSVRLTGALQTGQTRIFRSSGLTAIAERILTQKPEARAAWDFGFRILGNPQLRGHSQIRNPYPKAASGFRLLASFL